MIDKKKLVSRLKNHRSSLEELSEVLKADKGEVKEALDNLESQGTIVDVSNSKTSPKTLLYHVSLLPEAGNVYFISGKDSKERTMKFAATSDHHFASLFHLPKTWHSFMKTIEDRGISRVYIAGDILDGNGIYKGHIENVVHSSMERQLDVASEAMSKHPNLEFWGIAGNHDYSFTQANGAKPIRVLESRLDNFKNLGDFRADVVYHGIRIRLLHGAGGRAYATSYPSQTYLRDLFKGMDKDEMKALPDIMIIGHYHTMYQGKDHGIHILQPGSFQDGENDYCLRRGLTGPNGGFAVSADYKNGSVDNLVTEYIQPRERKQEKGIGHKRRIIVK